MQLNSPEYLTVEELKKENSDLRSKLKDLRESLRKSEDRYRNLIESENSIILRIDAHGTILFANNFTLRFFGYTSREMIRKNIKILFPAKETSGEDLTNLFETILSDPAKYVQVENQNIRKNGELVWISWTNRAVRDEDGNIIEILTIGNDITGRKKTEDALKVEHDIREAVINNIGVGFVVADTTGNILSLNTAALKIHGFRNENERLSRLDQYIEEFELEYSDGNKVPLDKWPLARALRGEYIKDFKVKLIRHKSDGSRIISYNTVPIYDTDNAQKLIVLTLTDLTDLHLQNEALRKSERRYFSLFNNNTILGIAHCKSITDDKGIPVDYRIIQVNDAYSTITGVRREDIEGKTVREQFPGIDNFAFDYIGEYGKIAKEGGELNFEAFFEPLQQWLSIYVYSPSEGEFTAMFTDISERKKVEKILANERELFEGIFDNIPVMITIYDPEMKIFRFNNEYRKILGWTEEDAKDGNLMAKLYPDPDYRENVAGYMQTFEPGWKELRVIAKDGSVVDSSWAIIHLSRGIFIGIGIDIRQRKLVDDKLHENKERLQIIFNNAAIGIVEIDKDDMFINVNNRLCEILGYRCEDLIGKTIADITAPDDLLLSNELNKRLHNREFSIFNYEKRYIKSDGSLLWVHVTVSAIYDSDGHHLKSIGTVEDISERKIAEKKLHEALFQAEEGRNILTALMEHIPIGITIADAPDVKVRMISTYGLELLQQQDETISGINASEHPSASEAFHTNGLTPAEPHELPLFRATRNGEFVKNEEWLVRVKDGTLIPILCNAAPIFDNHGKLVGGVSSWQDIAERRRALELLRESEEKFRSLFENITEGVALHELIYDDNNDPVNYRIIDVNPAFKKYTGIEIEKAVGSLATELYNDLPYFKDYSRVATTGEPYKFESFYPAMKKHFVINVISPKKGQFATVFEDISDQKRIEQEMQHRNEELTRFIYTVSHDLKSPLVTIKMFTSYLKDDLNKQDKVSQEKDLKYINNAADKMGRLLNELLELSRIGRKEDPVSEVFLDSIIKNTTDLVAGRIRQSNVKIMVTAPPVILSGYIQRFIQLFQNLIDNAIKFMGNQHDPVVEIGAYTDDEGEVVLFVSDNGSGIDVRHQHKLFGLFEKLNPETEGTGIGLALVKRIVEVHGGRIWFTSEGINKGTTFYFTLKNTRIMNRI